jgi:HSP20 family molecular chaperone IbpA
MAHRELRETLRRSTQVVDQLFTEFARLRTRRGIAGRGFVRSFVLADGLEVDAAHLEHGLLHVDMSRPEDLPAVRRIPITTG